MRSFRSLLPTFSTATVLLSLLSVFGFATEVASREPAAAPQQLILAHYMPWYSAKTDRQGWGWHWTMNHFDPDQLVEGKPAIASHFTPLIGPYDSQDPIVLEYHLLTMKIAGIDGVIVDWYGLQDFRDYAPLHRATLALVDSIERCQMKFAICYEDQTIPALIEAGKLNASERVRHAVNELKWIEEHWFSSKSYVHQDGRPVLLSFGQNGLSDAEWTESLKAFAKPPLYFSLHHRRSAAVGAFDWPLPAEGAHPADRFLNEARQWQAAIPVAFPRFIDIYSQAGVGPSYGHIPDQDGQTFRDSLEQALRSKSSLIQLATWNDWGEGTIVEPSHEFGFRDLEVVQQLRRRWVDRTFVIDPQALELPLMLYRARRAAAVPTERLDSIAKALIEGQYDRARSELGSLPRNP